MFGGKMKAMTFSYDDGVTQDIKFIEILNKYGLKATFNLNSELLGSQNAIEREGRVINHSRIKKAEVRDIYSGHEVAVHTLTHPNLTELEEGEIVRQVEEDRKNLEDLVGYEVVGMAYPCGGVNNDERVAQVLRERTSIRYARTIGSTHSFDPQEDLLRFDPTVYHHQEWEAMFELGRAFVELEAERPQILFVWGHSYEFDIDDGWGRFEEFCRLIGERDDIHYGTNRDILLGTGR
jgi:peptidoglycan-N-acetylglucosamine deacetylase